MIPTHPLVPKTGTKGGAPGGSPQSLNKFGYVMNNPGDWTDSSGAVCDEDCMDDKMFGAFANAFGGGGRSSHITSGCDLGPDFPCAAGTSYLASEQQRYVDSQTPWYGSEDSRPASNTTSTGTTIWVNCSPAGEQSWECGPAPGSYGLFYDAWQRVFVGPDRGERAALELGRAAKKLDGWEKAAIGNAALSGAAAVADAVVTDIALVENGRLFGTRYQGNVPLFNNNDFFRIGWSRIGRTGEYTFRIGGDLVEAIKTNPHINLWPPSWWFK